MWRPLTLVLVLSALVDCVGNRPLGDNQACPCAPGWTCDTSRNVCIATTAGCPGGAVRVPGPGSCSAPAGHVLPYSTVAALEALIEGDWLRCSGSDYAGEFGPGLRISADHTWSALVTGDGGTLEPITSGFDGYGTWTVSEAPVGNFQVNLLIVAGGATGGFATFTDTGQMRLDNGNRPAPDYVRLSGGGACIGGGPSSSGAGGGGLSGSGIAGFSGSGGAAGGISGSSGGACPAGTVRVPGPGDCSAPDGHVVPSTTVADLEAFVEGDWLRCRGVAYPSADAAGLRISPDHTWSALVTGDAGMLDPITTGLDGYGTWQVLAENRQLVMHPVTGGGPIAFVTFTDTGQMRIDFEGPTSDLVRLSGGGCIANGAGGSSGSGGGSGGGDAGGVTVTIPGPGDCAAPDGQLLPYATLADLEVLIEADWLRCIGSLPGDVGLRISPDHTWNSLERARDGMLHPVTTGFDGHGTWTAEEVYAGHFQFDLFKVTGGSVGGLINFTDSGQVWLSGGDFGGSWVRLAAGDAGAGP